MCLKRPQPAREGRARARVLSPSTATPSTCSGGMVGTPPNCRCPGGTSYQRRRGRCLPIQHTCPTGYRVLTTPNKYGAYCEQIPVPTPQQPPKPTETRRPCPAGTIGRWPRCRPVQQKCPHGLTGPKCDQVLVKSSAFQVSTDFCETGREPKRWHLCPSHRMPSASAAQPA
jgi:hypothetical protein